MTPFWVFGDYLPCPTPLIFVLQLSSNGSVIKHCCAIYSYLLFTVLRLRAEVLLKQTHIGCQSYLLIDMSQLIVLRRSERELKLVVGIQLAGRSIETQLGGINIRLTIRGSRGRIPHWPLRLRERMKKLEFMNRV